MDKAAVSEKYTNLGQVSTQKNQRFCGEFLLAREFAVLMMDWSEFLWCPNGLQDSKSLPYKFFYI